MKTILALLLTGSLLISCHKGKKGDDGMAITLMRDVTDSFAATPNGDPVLSLYGLADNPEKAAQFRLVVISDKRLNPVFNVALSSGRDSRADRSDDPQYRKRQIVDFYSAVRKGFKEFGNRYGTHGSKGNSECFCTIANELRELSEAPLKRKVLIIYSDLLENSEGFNCYTKSGRAMMRSDPALVGRILARRCPLPGNLAGITACFVYQPVTREDEGRFMDMLSVYRLLLEQRGATVVVQARGDNYAF